MSVYTMYECQNFKILKILSKAKTTFKNIFNLSLFNKCVKNSRQKGKYEEKMIYGRLSDYYLASKPD